MSTMACLSGARRLLAAFILPCALGISACGGGDGESRCDQQVDVARGRAGASGSSADPLGTITEALDRARGGQVVCVSAGTYGAATGESFPLEIPDHVTLRAASGPSVTLLTGSGQVDFGGTSAGVAVVAKDGSVLEGFTVRVPSSDPGSVHVGVYAGEGSAVIRGNVLEDIAMGLAGGAGVAADGTASPLIERNHIAGCHDGIATFGSAAPVVRGNTLDDNENNGVYAAEQSAPDLGTADDPGANQLQGNLSRGLYNYTSASTIHAAGNTWNVNCSTDPAGRYAITLVNGPADDAGCGGLSNYRIENAGASIQF